MSHISQVLWQFLVKWLTNFSLYPPEASKIAPQMDALYFFMVLVSLIGLTIVILLVTSFSILYSKKRHPVGVPPLPVFLQKSSDLLEDKGGDFSEGLSIAAPDLAVELRLAA